MARETDAWVISALKKVLRSSPDTPITTSAPADVVEDANRLIRDVRAQTISEISKMVTHELDPLVGTLRRAGPDEVPNYEKSDVSRVTRNLNLFLSALTTLHEASRAPQPEEFSLSDLIFEGAHTVTWERQQSHAAVIPIQYARRDHVGASGDPGLIRLAYLNILRNAVEASDPSAGGEGHSVLVNWDTTDRDTWIAVFDRGIGLPSSLTGMAKPGVTTKERGRHSGMGLTIAGIALESMNGTISPRPRRGGGAVAVMRWE